MSISYPCGCPGTITFLMNDATQPDVNIPNSTPGYEYEVFRISGQSGRTVNLDCPDGSSRVVYSDTAYYRGSINWIKTGFTKSDPNCQSSATYDCINGSCIASGQYNTPGIFSTLELCQSKCSLAANNCDGQCISNEEYSQIQSAIAQKQRDCG
jgi:hypothetical protein